jgi:hypothetical protein
MNPAVWMVTASVGSALAASIVAPGAAAEIVLGMAAPLLAVIATRAIVERQQHVDAAGLFPAMLKAFMAKVVFFVAYVIAMVKGLELRPEPFVTSFAVYFAALYGAQAALFKRDLLRASRAR